MKLNTSHDVEAGQFSMSAMSDIAFLLIIFFMVCGHFVEKSSSDVELPLASGGEESDELPIRVTITREEDIFVNGMSLNKGELRHDLKGRVRRAETPADKTVMLRASRALDYKSIGPIVDAVNSSGGMLELSVLQE